MPAVGDQHALNGVCTNPFGAINQEDSKPHINEYTAQQIAVIQSRLDKLLGPEYISSRAGPGGQKVHYLAAEKVIGLANEIFGFNGWSSSIQNIQIDFVDEAPNTGKISLGLSVTVRVTLKDGTFHEDIGYGSIQNAPGKAAAFEKAKKEGTTDGLKRALRTFGNVLGNCLYDKDYVKKVSRVKVGAPKWDEDNLHRHPDFVTKKEVEDKTQMKQEKMANAQIEHNVATAKTEEGFELADFDDAEFDENDFHRPDEVVLPPDPPAAAKRPATESYPIARPALPHNATTPSRLPTNAAQRPKQFPPNMNSDQQSTRILQQQNPQAQHSSSTESLQSPGMTSEHFAAGRLPNTEVQAQGGGFFSARAAELIDAQNKLVGGISTAARFDMHAESPSIRKTSGVDHNRSGRLYKNLKPDNRSVEELQQDATNPQSDPTRKLGMPNHGGQSPMHRGNSSAYRPPTRRVMDASTSNPSNAAPTGGVDRVLQATNAGRTALADVSNVTQNATASTDGRSDAKRQRTVGPDSPAMNQDENGRLYGEVG